MNVVVVWGAVVVVTAAVVVARGVVVVVTSAVVTLNEYSDGNDVTFKRF